MIAPWPKTILEDVCIKITDGAHASPKSVAVGLPMASVKDLTQFGINIETCRHISIDDFKKLVRQGCKPEIGDILISKDGASALDTVCEIKDELNVVLLSSVAILKPNKNKITSSFLRYFLDCETTRQYLKNGFITGAAIPRVILKDFKRCEISLPPLPTQRKIASILSAYTDLIENNTRRIKILEEMAQALYREWFVKFRFPGHEKLRIVDSLLGQIPEGWEVVPLGELAIVITKGTTPTTLGKEFKTDGINFFKVESIDQEGGIEDGKLAKIDSETHELLKRSQLRAGDILFSIAGAIGRTTIIPERVLPANTNQALAIIRTLNENRTYIFYCVRADEFQHFSLGRVVQTAQANVSLGILKSAPIIMPPKGLLAEFTALASSFIQLQENLRSRNITLRRTRDLLLPKLISGEVDVENIKVRMPDYEIGIKSVSR